MRLSSGDVLLVAVMVVLSAMFVFFAVSEAAQVSAAAGVLPAAH